MWAHRRRPRTAGDSPFYSLEKGQKRCDHGSTFLLYVAKIGKCVKYALDRFPFREIGRKAMNRCLVVTASGSD